MKYLTFLVASLLLLFACNPEASFPASGPIEPEEPKPPLLEVAWATRMNHEGPVVNLNNGVLYDEWFIYSDGAKLMAFNKDTGDKDWEYEPKELQLPKIQKSALSGNVYLARAGDYVIAIDLDSRTLKWADNIREMDMRLRELTLAANGKLYVTADYRFATSDHQPHLFEFDPETGARRTVYVAPRPDSIGQKSISPPAIWQDEQGDEYAIFNYRPNAQEPPGDVMQYLMAVNLRTQEELWSTKVNDGFASNGLHPPVLYKDELAITGGDWSMYGFDLRTGEQRWRYAFDHPWAIWKNTNHLIHNNRLYVNNGQHDVACLNPKTGAVCWHNREGGANCTDNMVYYEPENWLVFTSWGYGSVMVLDAVNGGVLHRERAYAGSAYNNDVVYDPERDMFFTSTYEHAIGFRVNRE